MVRHHSKTAWFRSLTHCKRWLASGLLALGMLAPGQCWSEPTIPTNKPIPLSGQFYDPYGIVPDEISFVWKPETEPAYQIAKESLYQSHSAPIDPSQHARVYEEVYQQPGQVWQDFGSWKPRWGPRPLAFQVKLVMSNWAFEASQNAAVRVTLYAKLAPKKVSPGTYLTNIDAMNQSARWMKVSSTLKSLPALGPEEQYTFYSDPIKFGSLLNRYPTYFPVELKAVVGIEQTVNEQRITRTSETVMTVSPTHFATFTY